MKKYLFLLLFAIMIFTGCSPPEPEVITTPETIVTTQETGPKTIFRDNFDNRKNEWQQITGVWKLGQNGFFMQTSSDPRHLNAIIYVDHPQVADGTYETYVRVVPDLPATITASEQDQKLLYNVRYIIGAGIIFRMRDKDNFYMFRLAGEEGAVLGKMEGGQWKDLANPRSTNYLTSRVKFSGNNWYRLKVDAYGGNIKCYINDSVVASVNDSTFTLGKFGLVTFKTRADFDFIAATDKTVTETK